MCSIHRCQVALELYHNTTTRHWLSRIVITINAPLVHLQVLLVNYSITCLESTLLVSVKLHLSCTIAIVHSNSPVAAHMSQQPCYNVTKCMLIQLVLFVCKENKFVDHISPQYLFNNYDVYPCSHMVWHNQLVENAYLYKSYYGIHVSGTILHDDTSLDSNILPFHITFSSPEITDTHRLYT